MKKQLTQIEVAALLGVSRGQVHMWWKRRERNGFPDRMPTEDGSPVYDARAVQRWFDNYVPSRGGRPKK